MDDIRSLPLSQLNQHRKNVGNMNSLQFPRVIMDFTRSADMIVWRATSVSNSEDRGTVYLEFEGDDSVLETHEIDKTLVERSNYFIVNGIFESKRPDWPHHRKVLKLPSYYDYESKTITKVERETLILWLVMLNNPDASAADVASFVLHLLPDAAGGPTLAYHTGMCKVWKLAHVLDDMQLQNRAMDVIIYLGALKSPGVDADGSTIEYIVEDRWYQHCARLAPGTGPRKWLVNRIARQYRRSEALDLTEIVTPTFMAAVLEETMRLRGDNLCPLPNTAFYAGVEDSLWLDLD